MGRYFIVFCLLWISLGNGTLAFASCFKCGDDFKIGFGEVSRSLSWIYYTEPATFSDNQKLWIDNFFTPIPFHDEGDLGSSYGWGILDPDVRYFKVAVSPDKPSFILKSTGDSNGTNNVIARMYVGMTLEPCYTKVRVNGKTLKVDTENPQVPCVIPETVGNLTRTFTLGYGDDLYGDPKVYLSVEEVLEGEYGGPYVQLPNESAFTIELLAFEDSKNDSPGACGSGGSGSAPSSPGLNAGSPESSGGGSVSVPAPSISYAFGLGKIDAETSAGKLRIAADTLTAASFTPAILSCEERDGVEKILDGSGNIRQIYAPDTLANVVTTDSDTFEIKFYATTGSESVDGSGYYIPVGSPLVTWKVDKISSTKMEVTKTEGALVDSSTMEKISGGWKVTSQGGDRVEQLTWADTSSGGVNQLRRTRIIEDHRGMSPVLTSKVVTDYEEFTWDWEVVVEAEDPDGANRVTEWTYYDETILTALSVLDPEEDPRFGKAYTQQSPDGSWIKYLTYDASGSATQTLEGWKDIALLTGTTSNAKWTVKSDITDGTKTEIFLEGHLAKRSDQLTTFSVTTDKAAREYSASGNYLDTITRIGGDGRTESVSYPDGRRDSYVFEEGTWNDGTSTFTAGTGPARRKTVKHGTDSAVDGIANKSTWDRTVTDAEGNTVLRETFVYTGSGTSLLASVRSHYDADNQLTSQTSNGRTVLTQTWTDGKLQSSTDEQGIVTTYTYDANGRTATETRTGLVTTYSYDIEGRLESQETEPES